MTAPLSDARIAEMQADEQVTTYTSLLWVSLSSDGARYEEYVRVRQLTVELAAEVSRARGELHAVDAVLDRRDALAPFDTRVDKILHLIRCAQSADPRAALSKAEDALNQARGEIAQLRKALDWQPISTAPRDVKILMYSPPKHLYVEPDGKDPDVRVSTTRLWTWASHWVPLSAFLALLTPPAEQET